MRDIFDYLTAMPDIPNEPKCWGKEYTSKCPCGGTLTVIRSRYNGHIRCKCDKCDFSMIE